MKYDYGIKTHLRKSWRAIDDETEEEACPDMQRPDTRNMRHADYISDSVIE